MASSSERVPRGAKMDNIQFRIPVEVSDLLSKMAKKRNTTKQAIIREAVAKEMRHSGHAVSLSGVGYNRPKRKYTRSR